LDSLEWRKPYEVLSISRQKLRSPGFPDEQIALLIDEDMARIAYWLENQYKDHGFDDDVQFIVRLELTEKGWKVAIREDCSRAWPGCQGCQGTPSGTSSMQSFPAKIARK
jgi:hypothetical protein